MLTSDQVIKAEYMSRRERNPRYSVRAFARFAGIPSGRMSQILSRKRRITAKMGRRLAAALAMGGDQERRFLAAIDREEKLFRQGRGLVHRLQPNAQDAAPDLLLVAASHEALIGEPLHFAILSLMETVDYRPEIGWIAVRLGESPLAVADALQNLQRAGYVDFIEGQGWQRLLGDQGVRTSADVPSRALRRAHKKILKEAAQSLDSVNVLLRDLSSMTMAIDPSNLAPAKALMREFRQRLAALLEHGQQTEVYRLAMQLFPVSQPRPETLRREP